MEQDIRYCTTSDGVRIAYSVLGDGPPLVIVPGWVSHLELEWQLPAIRETGQAYARHFRLVRMDKRGTGLSDRGLDDYSLEARVKDVEAVVDDLGVETLYLVGRSEGGPTCIAYAANHPDRVLRMSMYGAFARGSGLGGSAAAQQAVQSIVQAEWALGSKLLADLLLGEDADPQVIRFFVAAQRMAATPEDATAILQATLKIDVRDLLPRVSAPTLLLHSRDDRIVPIELAREVAAGIPGARFASTSGPHVSLGNRDRLNWQLESELRFFLGKEAAGVTDESPGPSSVRAVLFTDLVGHTEMMSRLGDERGREVLREHERITRDVLKGHGGREVKTLGDGFMASFGSVTRAVECAMALQRAVAQSNASLPAHPEPVEGRAEPGDPARATSASARAGGDAPLQVRVGLNAGEPIEEEGDLFGATVILAARIAAKAQGGEILVADTVRGLCAGKGFLFADRGEFVAKGFEEPVRLYEVRWRQ